MQFKFGRIKKTTCHKGSHHIPAKLFYLFRVFILSFSLCWPGPMLYCSLFKYDIHNDVLDTSYYCYSLHVAGMAHHLSMGAGEGPWGSAFSRSLGHYPSPYLPPHCGPPGLHPPNFPRMLALSAAAAEHSLHQPPRSKSESDTVIRDKIT